MNNLLAQKYSQFMCETPASSTLEQSFRHRNRYIKGALWEIWVPSWRGSVSGFTISVNKKSE